MSGRQVHFPTRLGQHERALIAVVPPLDAVLEPVFERMAEAEEIEYQWGLELLAAEGRTYLVVDAEWDEGPRVFVGLTPSMWPDAVPHLLRTGALLLLTREEFLRPTGEVTLGFRDPSSGRTISTALVLEGAGDRLHDLYARARLEARNTGNPAVNGLVALIEKHVG